MQGAHNLVVPIRSSMSNISRRKLHQNPQIGLTTMHKGCEYCWPTQEDVVCYLLSSIGLFSPVAALPIDTLGIIDVDVLAIDYHSPASSSLSVILHSLRDQTFVAVVDENEALSGEISPFTLTCCNEAMAGSLLARKMAHYMWRVKRRKWEMDRQIPSLLELILMIKLAKIAKMGGLLSILEML